MAKGNGARPGGGQEQPVEPRAPGTADGEEEKGGISREGHLLEEENTGQVATKLSRYD